MKDEKYIVIKRNDVQWRDAHGDDAKTGKPFDRYATITDQMVLHDAAVIRTQDAFSGPALDAYANAIGVAIVAMKKVRPINVEEWEEQIANLQRSADYFHERAVEAHQTEGKLPD